MPDSNSFARAFPKKDLFHGRARWALLGAVLGSVVYGLFLVDLFLIADLLIGRGEVDLIAADVPDYQTLTDVKLLEAVAKKNLGENPPISTWSDQGLAATVWSIHQRSGSQLLAWLCRSVPALRRNIGALTCWVFAGVGLGFAHFLLVAYVGTESMRTAVDVGMRLRQMLHRQALRLGPSELNDAQHDQALELFNGDVDRVRHGVFQWVDRVSRQPVKLALLVVVCLSINWLVTLECLIPMAACWHLVQREKRRLESARRLTEDRAKSRMQLLAEGLRKSRLVRGFSMEAFEHERFQTHLERVRKQLLSANQQHTWSRWLSRVFVVVCMIFVLMLVGSKTLLPGSPAYISFSAALLLLGAFASLHRPLQDLWNLNWELDDAGLAADRIYRYLDTTPQVGQAVGAKFLQPLMKLLKYEDVTYRLSDNRNLLENFNVQIAAGEVTAFVSLDPVEPRAAAYLLPRFIEPHAGRILFDGEDIAWVTLESLRMESIYVGGADAFFTGSVLENLTCGNTQFSLQDATEAAKEAHAHAFVLRLPQGYETVLGEHGERLDAGQSFRLGLARAVLRDPALLIIEEPDARLDDDTKSLLDDAYNRLSRDRTVIFLPSRLSTVRRADRVILIHRGKIEAVGSHSKLLKVSPLYRHWEYLRFNEYKTES